MFIWMYLFTELMFYFYKKNSSTNKWFTFLLFHNEYVTSSRLLFLATVFEAGAKKYVTYVFLEVAQLIKYVNVNYFLFISTITVVIKSFIHWFGKSSFSSHCFTANLASSRKKCTQNRVFEYWCPSFKSAVTLKPLSLRG